MIELQKSELESVLLQIAAYSSETKQMVAGLLREEVTLRTKRRLQKIHNKVQLAYKELLTDVESLKKECGEDKEKLQKELEILLKEKVTIDEEKANMEDIEKITSSSVYDFNIIEKFAN